MRKADSTAATAGSGSSSSSRRHDKDRPSGRSRDPDLVDYVHDRDRIPRPSLKHRESSREGRRRHEYRYYEPQSGHQRVRSEERRSPGNSGSTTKANSPDKYGDSERSAPREYRGRRRYTSERPSETRTRSEYRRDDRLDDRHDERRHERRDSRRPSDDSHGRRRSAAANFGKVALAAGAMEAVKQKGRKERKERETDAWKRVATAAIGAAAIDVAAGKARGKDPRDRGKGSLIGASIGGLVLDSLVNKVR
ncbi:hypothetical protein KVR01_009890 [Diaporthe batatas]|uniref:uncharacterized protein n=1 Tax=Diaporthe batatas TaxID=748121 RepID=UPI001D054E7F|nr:uncharacterized protein KVR01_009890 [Diaporthe batatas]KAG8160354.1 hypothetical protein KVR01_009890 [Diaporthe batatas]